MIFGLINTVANIGKRAYNSYHLEGKPGEFQIVIRPVGILGFNFRFIFWHLQIY